MITRLETIESVKPIFQEYLEYMAQFFDIHDVVAWSQSAQKHLYRYLKADDRYIFILKASDAIIGFAMINQHRRFNAEGLSVAEFYIQQDHGGKGYGRRLAEHVFEQFPGDWEVAVTLKNKPALAFWEQVVSAYTRGKFIMKKQPSFQGYGFLFTVMEKPGKLHGI